MYRVLLVVSIAALLTACGGSPRPADPVSQVSGPGQIIDGQVLCEVGALAWNDDDVLTISFWNDHAEGYVQGGEVVLTGPDGMLVGIGAVHRTNPEAGAMAVRVPGDQLLTDLPRGAHFLIPLP